MRWEVAVKPQPQTYGPERRKDFDFGPFHQKKNRQTCLSSLSANKINSAVGHKLDQTKKGNRMLWTICVVLIILWLLGLVTGTTMGGLIHVLLVIAIIVVLVRIITGKKPLWPIL
jgi:hypothetical protein